MILMMLVSSLSSLNIVVCNCILYHCNDVQMMARDSSGSSSFLSGSFSWVFSFRVANLQLQMLILWMPRHVPVWAQVLETHLPRCQKTDYHALEVRARDQAREMTIDDIMMSSFAPHNCHVTVILTCISLSGFQYRTELYRNFSESAMNLPWTHQTLKQVHSRASFAGYLDQRSSTQGGECVLTRSHCSQFEELQAGCDGCV